jgi:branched-chain amino acid transport system permease protein
MMRSGAVLIATVIGGTAVFFGPVAGAVVLTFFSVAVASVTRAWLFYLGLFFIVVVVISPDGLAGFVERHAARVATHGWQRCRAAYLWGTAAALLWTAAVVLAVQWAYAVQFGLDDGGVFSGTGGAGGMGALVWLGGSPLKLGAVVFMLAALGGVAAHYAIRAQARLAATLSSATHTDGDAR